MPGVSGVTVTTCVRATLSFARKTAGASGARHSLRPLIFRWRESFRKTRTHRAARTRWCVFSRSLKIESGMVRTPHQRRPGEARCVKSRTLADDAESFSQLSSGAGAACSSCIRKCSLEERCSPHFASARLFTQPGRPGPIRRGARVERRWSRAFAQRPRPGVMGPGLRQDDTVYVASACHFSLPPGSHGCARSARTSPREERGEVTRNASRVLFEIFSMIRTRRAAINPARRHGRRPATPVGPCGLPIPCCGSRSAWRPVSP